MNKEFSLKEIYEYQYSDIIWDKAFSILDKFVIEYCRKLYGESNDK